jgi:hypothetical protein
MREKVRVECVLMRKEPSVAQAININPLRLSSLLLKSSFASKLEASLCRYPSYKGHNAQVPFTLNSIDLTS